MNHIKNKSLWASIIVVVAVTAGGFVYQTKQVNNHFNKQQSGIELLTKQVAAQQKSNPNLLTTCLNDAGTTYVNSIKGQSGVALDPVGSVAYVTDQVAFKVINDKLEADRKACHTLYGE